MKTPKGLSLALMVAPALGEVVFKRQGRRLARRAAAMVSALFMTLLALCLLTFAGYSLLNRYYPPDAAAGLMALLFIAIAGFSLWFGGSHRRRRKGH